MWKWRQRIWFDKKPLVGLVVRIEDNPWQNKMSVRLMKRLFIMLTGFKTAPAAATVERTIEPMAIFSGMI